MARSSSSNKNKRAVQQPQSRSDGSPGSERRSKKKGILVFGSLVLVSCAVNLRLHSKVTAGGVHGGIERDEPKGDDAHRDVSIIDGESIGANVPTWRPTTWGPTATSSSISTPYTYNQTTSSLPTLIAITNPAESLNAQKSEDGLLSDHTRSKAHPRVACFPHNDIGDESNPNKKKTKKGSSCKFVINKDFLAKKIKRMTSIPKEAKSSTGDLHEVDPLNVYNETDTCKYPDPSNRATAAAPTTCNDIHSLGFDPGMFQSSPTRAPVEYLTMGGAKCIWKVTGLNDDLEQETFILKSHKNSRFLKRHFWDLSRKDALISGGEGNTQLSAKIQSQTDIPDDWNHVLPMYHYCALANVVPLADGTLLEYLRDGDDKRYNPRRLGPVDTLRMALQAARGLYQAHLYWDGKPTFVHADFNPSQFLVFSRSHSGGGEKRNRLPILQVNDFNQGRFLTRSIVDGETCPFRSCTKNLRGNRWHSPERFLGCVDQDSAIDVYSLGDVFFFLLTNGFDPHYQVKNYGKEIREGRVPHIPDRLNLDHPAFVALKEVMIKCFALEQKDRPTSLEVVQMLEARLKQVEQ